MTMNCAPTVIWLNSGHLQARIPPEFPDTIEVFGANPPDIKNIGSGDGGNFRVWTSVNKYEDKAQTLIFKNRLGEILNCEYDSDGIFEPPQQTNAVFSEVSFDYNTRKLKWIMSIQVGILSYDVFDDGNSITNIPVNDGQLNYEKQLSAFARGEFYIVANGEDSKTFNSKDQGKFVIVAL